MDSVPAWKQLCEIEPRCKGARQWGEASELFHRKIEAQQKAHRVQADRLNEQSEMVSVPRR